MSDSDRNKPKPKIAYIATIRREGTRYYAYDEKGDWRAYGDAADAPATSGRLLAEFLFHPQEIASVKVMNGVTCVEIIDFS